MAASNYVREFVRSRVIITQEDIDTLLANTSTIIRVNLVEIKMTDEFAIKLAEFFLGNQKVRYVRFADCIFTEFQYIRILTALNEAMYVDEIQIDASFRDIGQLTIREKEKIRDILIDGIIPFIATSKFFATELSLYMPITPKQYFRVLEAMKTNNKLLGFYLGSPRNFEWEPIEESDYPESALVDMLRSNITLTTLVDFRKVRHHTEEIKTKLLNNEELSKSLFSMLQKQIEDAERKEWVVLEAQARRSNSAEYNKRQRS